MPNSIQDHLINIILVSIGYIVSMILVQSVIVPAQQQYLPAITTFAALIFPLHGVRVISAWLFGALVDPISVRCKYHHALCTDARAPISLSNRSYAWSLVSTVAWFTFEAFRVAGINLYQSMSSISSYTWRRLMLVAFVSSIINSSRAQCYFRRRYYSGK